MFSQNEIRENNNYEKKKKDLAFFFEPEFLSLMINHLHLSFPQFCCLLLW